MSSKFNITETILTNQRTIAVYPTNRKVYKMIIMMIKMIIK